MLSVIVPAYNEEGRIGESLHKIVRYLQTRGWAFEVIVVDDGSTDKTSEVVARAGLDQIGIRLLRNDRNRGKGAAVRLGVKGATGDTVLFSDADLSTPIEEIEKLLPWLDSYQLVIASRSLHESEVVVHQPFYRELMGKVFNLFVQALLVRGMMDTQCGFKLMTREGADRIFRRQRIDSFSFDVEMIVIAKRQGMGVREVPVKWINSRASRVHPVIDSVEMLLDLFRIKAYDMLGFYSKPD